MGADFPAVDLHTESARADNVITGLGFINVTCEEVVGSISLSICLSFFYTASSYPHTNANKTKLLSCKSEKEFDWLIWKSKNFGTDHGNLTKTIKKTN